MSETQGTTLAETLRAWVEAVDKTLALGKDVPYEMAIDPAHARFYLRGYDDARAECAAEIEENGEMKRRVQEVEAVLAAQDAYDHYAERDEVKSLRETVRQLEAQLAERPQPAPAVGVVGTVRYAAIRERDGVLSTRAQFTHPRAQVDMQKCRDVHGEPYRVVAIVDTNAIVPLNSKEPVAWRDDRLGEAYFPRSVAAQGNTTTVTPLYAGRPEPAQGEA